MLNIQYIAYIGVKKKLFHFYRLIRLHVNNILLTDVCFHQVKDRRAFNIFIHRHNNILVSTPCTSVCTCRFRAQQSSTAVLARTSLPLPAGLLPSTQNFILFSSIFFNVAISGETMISKDKISESCVSRVAFVFSCSFALCAFFPRL